MQLLDTGWRWSVRFGAAALASLAVTAPAYAAVDGHDNLDDPGSLYRTAQTVMGADEYWARGYTGRGVDVALIDTGVTPVKGLDNPGQVIHGPDLSFESQYDETRHLDTFGHGTHMAGIIAGRDPDASWSERTLTSKFLGVAPEARLVSLKVGDAHGAVDVSQVVAAIDWVVKNRRRDGMNIRVLNLSYGTDSEQVYTSDPVTHAVQQAWKKGVVVVVSAGNAGFGSAALNNPATNPHVIAVGGLDGRGTSSHYDDVVPDWSSSGDAARQPDVVAPGTSVTSLRNPGSYLDEQHPSAVVAERFFRGSGTSQAAAFVAGAAALIIQERPSITPDQLKALLKRNAERLSGVPSSLQGAGAVDLEEVRGESTPSTFSSLQSHLDTTGIGSLDGSRGSGTLELDGIALSGEVDVFGNAWPGPVWALASSTQTSWVGGLFNGVAWTGDSLVDGLFQSVEWEGTDWTGSRWKGSRWTGSRWTGSRWTGDGWEGSRWTGSRWKGSRWKGSRWKAGVWSSAGYGEIGTAADGETVVDADADAATIADVAEATGEEEVTLVEDVTAAG